MHTTELDSDLGLSGSEAVITIVVREGPEQNEIRIPTIYLVNGPDSDESIFDKQLSVPSLAAMASFSFSNHHRLQLLCSPPLLYRELIDQFGSVDFSHHLYSFLTSHYLPLYPFERLCFPFYCCFTIILPQMSQIHDGGSLCVTI
jgi:hypothetical protein